MSRVDAAYKALQSQDAARHVRRARAWYGDDPPTQHAVCVLASIADSPFARPYLHIAYCGRDAYDASHTYTYLKDLMYARASADLIEPAFLALHLGMQAIDEPHVEFVELGSTLFAAIEKFANCATYTGPSKPVRFVGIELSDWLRELSATLHPSGDLSLYPHWQEVPTSSLPRFLFSMGVGVYAFTTTQELASWLIPSRMAIIREKFTLAEEDFTTHLMGKRYTCFSLSRLTAALKRAGKHVTLLSSVESEPFLDVAPPRGVLFVNAFLLIHDFTDKERAAFTQAFQACGAPSERIYYNTPPSFGLSADVLSKGATLPDQVWGRRYVRKRRRLSHAALAMYLREHLRLLDQAYPGAYPARALRPPLRERAAMLVRRIVGRLRREFVARLRDAN